MHYDDRSKRKYIRSLECQSKRLLMRNRELTSILVSLGKDVEPYTDDVDPPFRTPMAPYTAVVSPPTISKPKMSKELTHNRRGKSCSQADAAIAQSVRQEPAGIPPEHRSNRDEDPYTVLPPLTKVFPKRLRHEQQRTVLSHPWSLYRRKSPPTVAVSIRGIAERAASAYREAEALLCWITSIQGGKRILTYAKLLKDSLRYNIEELEAAIKVRNEDYGRELWFSLEDGKHHAFLSSWMP